jgi:DNA-binding response OmpR family regulator
VNGRKRIYVIEDDSDIRVLLRQVLEGYGYGVTTFASGRDARQAIHRDAPDLCIVDLGLPDMDGLTLVRELWGDVRFGVIILTGRGGVSDRVLGLELGADDYVVKPFEPRELVARINSVIRRREQLACAAAACSRRARFADWLFDSGDLSLTRADGRQEALTARHALFDDVGRVIVDAGQLGRPLRFVESLSFGSLLFVGGVFGGHGGGLP